MLRSRPIYLFISCIVILTTVIFIATASDTHASPLQASKNSPLHQTGLVPLKDIVQIVAGRYHTCAINVSGDVTCWGRNGWGQLGNGTTSDSSLTQTVSGLDSDITMLTSGWGHTCALAGSGNMKCWGRNHEGQVGNDASTEHYYPVDVIGLTSNIVAISANHFHTCVLTSSDGVKCWGDNEYGQLGNGTTDTATSPVDVEELSSGIVDIVATGGSYGSHTCVLTEEGGMKCWGDNSAGQLGTGNTTNYLSPVDVNGLGSRISAFDAGYNFTCALTDAGEAKCWGDNAWGKLGVGISDNQSLPVGVTSLSSGVAAIDTGEDHACAVMNNGEAKCWGANHSSQLGINSNATLSNIPVSVNGLSTTVNSISAGSLHTCALTNSKAKAEK